MPLMPLMLLMALISSMDGSWRIALRNLSRNKRRNIATGIAMGLGFAALLALGGYMNRVENYLRVYSLYANRVGHLTVYKRDGLERFAVKPATYSFTPAEQAVLRQAVANLGNTDQQGGQLIGTGLIGNGCRTLPFIATGIDPDLDRRLRAHPDRRRWAESLSQFTRGRGLWDYPADYGAIAIAEGLARLLHKPLVADDLPAGAAPVIVADCQDAGAKKLLAADVNVQLAAGSWSGMMSALDGEIVSQYNTGITETQNTAILTSLTHLQKLYDTPNVTYWSVWLRRPGQLAATSAALGKALADAGLSVDIYPWHDESVSPMYAGTMQFLYTMVSFIAFVLATVIVFSVFNASTMTVIERAPEIGMMRSLGYTKRQIRQLYLQEMLILAALSLLGGGIVGGIGISAVNAAAIPLRPPGVAGGMHLLLTPNEAIVGAAACIILLLAALTTLMAVRNVARRNIVLLLMGTQR